MYGFSDDHLELQESLSQRAIQVGFQKVPAGDRSALRVSIETQLGTASKVLQKEQQLIPLY